MNNEFDGLFSVVLVGLSYLKIFHLFIIYRNYKNQYIILISKKKGKKKFKTNCQYLTKQ